MRKAVGIFVFTLMILCAAAQNNPEFPRGAVLYLQAKDGMVTRFSPSPELFVASLGINPQVTVVPGYLRVGGTAEGDYTSKKVEGLFGPNIAVRLATLSAKNLGSILNLQLQLDHLWGTNSRRLIGGSLQTEIGQAFQIIISAHRDYGYNTWWFRGGIGYNIIRKKRKGLEDPMSN